ncbi:MAG: hypothetical protein AKCLJLPJ_00447 [Fimbriimonadales bacterium]|nr:hypothetical protein [Armatimonadota bacterium]MBV6502403.1 hypothetical protein [Fimbriimonadales bacterium]NOG93145.1 ABC transporter permease subunit [Armatimonadota bacterium]
MTFFEMFSWSLVEMWRPRRVWLHSIISAVGPAFAILMRFLADGFAAEQRYSTVASLSVYSFTLVILGIVLGTGIIASDVTGKTVQYLLTRPISRPALFLAKWLAAAVTVSIFTSVSALLCACILLGPDFLRVLERDLFIIPVAAVAYTSVFAALSSLLTRPVLLAVAYTIGLESWIWAVPGDFAKLSLMSYVRVLSGHEAVGEQNELNELLRALNPLVITESAAWNTILVVTVISLAVGAAVFATGQYIPKEETV